MSASEPKATMKAVVVGLARVQGPCRFASRSLATRTANSLQGGVTKNRVENVSLGAEGGYGRAKGIVRSKAEPWNERRVKNVSLGAKGDHDVQVRPIRSFV